MRIIKLSIVNIITIIRLIGALLLPIVYMNEGADISARWCLMLFLTDAIDGFLARTFKVATFFGSALDAISDKLLNTVSFVLLGLTYNIMFAPLILEISILLTIYNTYRQGGNIQSSKIGKSKTIIMDVCVIISFILLSISSINTSSVILLYIIDNTHYYIAFLGCIMTIFDIIALLDYKKKNQIARDNPKNIKVKEQKRIKKTNEEIIHDLFSTEYYLKNKNEPIMKQFFKPVKN